MPRLGQRASAGRSPAVFTRSTGLARNRQIVLINPDRNGGDDSMPPLGSLREVSDALGAVNTARDGSDGPVDTGIVVMHGPGFVVEIGASIDPVVQAMVTIEDEDMAWPVLMRLCALAKWSMMDLETGRTFGPGS